MNRLDMSENCLVMVLALCLSAVTLIFVRLTEMSQQYSDSHAIRVQQLPKQECPHTFPVSVGVGALPYGKQVRQFVFLKVHKAASGTAASIFFRFGITRGLKFVLPKFLNSISIWDSVKEKYIHPMSSQPFDIMNSHVLYNRTAIEQYIAKDAIYIGILREPYQQFKSSINYMQPPYVYNLSKVSPVSEYLKDPLKHEKANTKGPRFSWINNRQAVEFGFSDDVIMNKNSTAIDEYIQKLNQEFLLVLIAEYFDESIILLRRLFNWQIKDILYRSLHIRGWDRKNTLPRPHDRELFRKWASVDYALYEFFFKRLWQQINMAGSDFFDELLYFRKVRAEVDDFCKVTPNITGMYYIQESEWSSAAVIDADFCRLMFAEEEEFVKIIGYKQYGITKATPKTNKVRTT